VKCDPWHIDGRMLLIGDAAHAIVPFYGQGMNCGFEDCTILDECITERGFDWASVFKEFYARRKPNADAIADLALDNFVEMRDTSADPKFQLKRRLEHILEERFPGSFVSKYSMVTFRRLPYQLALQQGRLQDEILMEACRDVDSIDDIEIEPLVERIGIRAASLDM
jgi:kynurenine 3-monooxygenase